jgi:(1->4)-alpha-D-glucan 1-alpha-D-glucosylmutase
VLKITSPGVPDVYQGNELWDLSLVDPDNRRPVDFSVRQRLAAELTSRWQPDGSGELIGLCSELMENWKDGRIKLWTTLRALCFRRDHSQLFQFGRYLPLQGAVEKQQHLIAYAREYESELVLVAVPRLSYTLMNGELRPPLGDAWENAELMVPPACREFVNLFTAEPVTSGNGRTLLCREVFAHFPVALLAAR